MVKVIHDGVSYQLVSDSQTVKVTLTVTSDVRTSFCEKDIAIIL